MKVGLVIDDDSFWRRVITDILVERGYKVYQAQNGVEGITKALRYKPDVIVVDYILPKVNGAHVVKFLRENESFKNAGIVLMSFSDDFINEYWASEYGADLFIKKKDGVDEARRRLLNFLVVDFKTDKSGSFMVTPSIMDALMYIIDEDLRKEKLNRDLLELVEKVDDEFYVMRKLWMMLKRLLDIESLFILLVTSSVGRVYVFFKDYSEVSLNELKHNLLSLMKKPITPSEWSWGGNVRPSKSGIVPKISLYKVISRRDEELGVIAFGEMDKDVREKAATLMKDIQESLSILFRNLNLFRDYKVAADVDSLTGLFAKRVILAKAEEYVKLLTRQGIIFSIAMMDIDDFKKVNDSYGHIKGDEVLRRIGSIITETIRETDIAGRYGGEEFLIIFPGSNAQEACSAAERILERVRNYDWEKIGVGRLTLSAGVAQGVKGKTVTEIIEMADKALYEAKSRGKNRCVVYEGGEDLGSREKENRVGE